MIHLLIFVRTSGLPSESVLIFFVIVIIITLFLESGYINHISILTFGMLIIHVHVLYFGH